jgi:hypothetical protein
MSTDTLEMRTRVNQITKLLIGRRRFRCLVTTIESKAMRREECLSCLQATMHYNQKRPHAHQVYSIELEPGQNQVLVITDQIFSQRSSLQVNF